MKQDDPGAERILIQMQKLLAESRVLKRRHDELIEEYQKLKREFEKPTAEHNHLDLAKRSDP